MKRSFSNVDIMSLRPFLSMEKASSLLSSPISPEKIMNSFNSISTERRTPEMPMSRR
jgi:hypothetical protein